LRISNDVRHLVGRIEFDLHDFRQQSTEISHQITGLQVWSAIQLLLFIVLAFWLRRRSLAAPQKHRPTTATADVAAPLQPTTPDSANKPPLKPFMVRIQNHFTWPVPRKTDSNSSGDEHLFRDGLESFSDLSPAQSQQQQQQKPLASTQSKRSKKKSKRRHSMPATS
jgi:hypothetical protein